MLYVSKMKKIYRITKEEKDKRKFLFTLIGKKWNIQLTITILGLLIVISFISDFNLIKWIYPIPTPISVLDVKLVVVPNKTKITVGTNPIALTAQSTGTDLKFFWEKIGVGELKGNPADSIIFYIPPQGIGGDLDQAIVSVTVTNKNGQEVTESIMFSIVKLMPTPTPVKTIGSGGASKLWSEPNTGMEFVWVPAGTFKRGCNPCLSDECDTAKEIGVDIEMDGFWMGKYKVTEAQWKQVMGEGKIPAAYQQMYSFMGYNYPIRVFVPEARQFIQKLSDMNKGKYNFRLPQFIQWEYACRNTGKTPPSDCDGNKSSDQKTALPDITSVNAMSPNELGIYGMLVDWEWGDEPFPVLEGDQPSTALQSKELSLAFGSSCLYWFAAGYMPLTIRVIMIP